MASATVTASFAREEWARAARPGCGGPSSSSCPTTPKCLRGTNRRPCLISLGVSEESAVAMGCLYMFFAVSAVARQSVLLAVAPHPKKRYRSARGARATSKIIRARRSNPPSIKPIRRRVRPQAGRKNPPMTQMPCRRCIV